MMCDDDASPLRSRMQGLINTLDEAAIDWGVAIARDVEDRAVAWQRLTSARNQVTLALAEIDTVRPTGDAECHFPWHYTEFGVVCACGEPMRDEICPQDPNRLCESGCGCRYGTEDPDRRDCGCDGPCTTSDVAVWGCRPDLGGCGGDCPTCRSLEA